MDILVIIGFRGILLHHVWTFFFLLCFVFCAVFSFVCFFALPCFLVFVMF